MAPEKSVFVVTLTFPVNLATLSYPSFLGRAKVLNGRKDGIEE